MVCFIYQYFIFGGKTGEQKKASERFKQAWELCSTEFDKNAVAKHFSASLFGQIETNSLLTKFPELNKKVLGDNSAALRFYFENGNYVEALKCPNDTPNKILRARNCSIRAIIYYRLHNIKDALDEVNECITLYKNFADCATVSPTLRISWQSILVSCANLLGLIG